jgi:hypothetical protein
MSSLWKLRGIAVLLLRPVRMRLGTRKRRDGLEANDKAGSRVGRVHGFKLQNVQKRVGV